MAEILAAGVSICHHGSICLIRPMNPERRAQLQAITPEDAQWFAGALAVEPRYVDDILDAMMRGEGL